MNRVIISTAVWGTEYINIFLDIGLPSIVNQIKNYQNRENLKFTFIIFSPKVNHKILSEKTNLYHGDKIEFLNVDLKLIAWIDKFERATKYTIGKYNIHSKTVNETLLLAQDEDIILINYADFIWSSNLLTTVLQKLTNNYDIVLNHPLSIDTSECDFFKLQVQKNNVIGNSMIAEKSIRQTEWWYRQYEYLNSRGAKYMSLIYWKSEMANSLLYVFRGFHLNVLAFRKKTQEGKLFPQIAFGTLDGSYLPYQIKEMGVKEYFISNLQEGSVGAFTNRDISLFPAHSSGFYCSNLQRHAKVFHGKNEISNLKNYMVIFGEDLKPNDSDINELIKQSEFDVQNILEISAKKINTPDFTDLILGAEINYSFDQDKDIVLIAKLNIMKLIRIVLDLLSYIRIIKYILKKIMFINKTILKMIILMLRIKWKKHFGIYIDIHSKNIQNEMRIDEHDKISNVEIRTKYPWLRALKRGNLNKTIHQKIGVNRLFKPLEIRLSDKKRQFEEEFNNGQN